MGFDEQFFKEDVKMDIRWPSGGEVLFITSLRVYPLKYATKEMELKLRKRGEVFWTCRSRKFVSYDVPLQGMEEQIVSGHSPHYGHYQ
jgi:hypothetical protein